MAAAYPSGNPGNVFIPSFEASGQLVVSYSRNPKDFPLNQYTTLVPVKKSIGYFLQITAENAARLLTTDGSDFVWPDGSDTPRGYWNDESFQFQPFVTTRFAPTVTLGYKTVEQADWKIKAYHAAMLAQQAMTLRALRVNTLVTTSANWPAAQVATATSLGGGFWSAGTATAPYILETLQAASQLIQIATLGVVRPKDMVLVIGPGLASAMAASQEIHTYLQNSIPAAKYLSGEDGYAVDRQWGLPMNLYGYKVVVDDTVYGSNTKGTTFSPGYLWGSNSAVLLARPGALVGVEGAPSFSTVEIFSYEEMTVESKDDSDNRRHLLRVTDDYGVNLVSPISGFLITHTLS